MPRSRPFDELWGLGLAGSPREGFETLARWLEDTPGAELARRQQSAEAAFRSLGITFAVYGDDQAAERAEAVGVKVVQDRCIKIEHSRLMR